MKPIHIHFGLYNSWIVAYLGWPRKKAKLHCFKNWNTDPISDTAQGCTGVIGKGTARIAVIYLEEFKTKNPCDIALLVHEVIHACLLILYEIGQHSVCTKDHEYFTYMTQHATQVILEKLKDTK